MKKHLLLISGLSLLAIVSCTKDEHEQEKAVKYVVSTPYQTDTTITREYVCQIKSSQHIEMRALEEGYLEHIFVDEGQFIKKGQIMFQIMPQLYQAELQKATAEANYAEIEFKNTKQLADSNVVSQNELALAKARYDKALAEQSLAAVHLNFTEIKAPFDGIMDRFHVREGSLLEEGEILTTLSDNSKMWVYFNVPEAEYLDYSIQLNKDSIFPVKLKMANNKVFKHEGFIETIEADFNNETGNISFRAAFPNPDGLLRHGETGNILIETPFKNALLIPQKATYEILDKRYVYVIDDEGKVSSKEIHISAELPHLFIISDGISSGDKILLEGLRKVKNGDQIDFESKGAFDVIKDLKLHAE